MPNIVKKIRHPSRHIAQREPIEIWRKDTKNSSSNLYGEFPVVKIAEEYCGVLYFFQRLKPTSVRSDSSPSKKRTMNSTSDGRFIFDYLSLVELDDQVIFRGKKHRVVGVYRREALRGRVGNIEVELESW